MTRCFLLILILFSAFSSFSQQVAFKSISAKDGLSQNDVNCILQDSQGFMWLGTYDGLNRYDGYDFKSYHLKTEDNTSLNSNLIQCIAEDKFKNIWVGTSDRGLNIIRYKSENIESIFIHEDSINLIEKEKIIGIDFFDDKAIIFTKEYIFLLQISESGFEPIKIGDSYRIETNAFAINCFQKISNSEYLMGTSNSLTHIKINLLENKVEFSEVKKWLNVSDIKPFREGYLISCLGKLFYLNKKLKLRRIAFTQYSSLLVKDDTHIWCASKNGLHYVELDKNSLDLKKVTTYTKENTNDQLASNIIKCIFKDKMGMLWLGTANSGVIKLSHQLNKFKLYKKQLTSSNLKNNHIKCFFEDSKNNLWIGTDGGGISYFHSSIKDYNKIPLEIADDEKAINNINCFHEFKVGDSLYMIASTAYPINVQTYTLNGQRIYLKNLEKVFNKITHPIHTIDSDEQYLWLGTSEGGLIRYDYIHDVFKRFLTRQIPTLASNLIRSVCIDPKSRVWIGTNKGLNMLTPDQRHKALPKFKLYTHKNSDSTSLSYDYILPIIETKSKEIWIGTLGGGLNKYQEESDSFVHWTTKDGLPNNNIKSIVEDKENQIWVSTNKGISSINPITQKISNYSISDGLQDNEFREMAGIRRKSGELLFGGNNGFNSVYPEQLQLDTTSSELVFTQMLLSGSLGHEDEILNRAQLLNYQKQDKAITRSYNQNSFTAHFSALNYLAPKKIQYKYRLLGFEEKWTQINAQSRFAKYTNLHPGDYTLEVTASNSDNIWSQKPLTIKLKINKPWYKTNLAFFIYSLLILTLIYFSKRYSLIRNKMRQELLMARFEKQKEKELTKVKLRFFTNISHELRTPLTIIKGYFDHVIPQWDTLPKEKVNKDFAVIGRNVDNLLRLLGQILDFRKLEQHKMKLLPQQKDIVTFTNSIITSFQLLADNKRITLQFKHESAPIILWFDADKMEKIISNLLSNAIKYTHEGGQVKVSICELEEEVKIEVSDNGIGIPEEDKKSIFNRFYQVDENKANIMQSTGIGLSLSKGLINLHKGSIKVESKVGEGSSFILHFKKGKAHFGSDAPNEIITETIKDNSPTEKLSSPKSWDSTTTTDCKEKLILVVEDNKDLRTFLKEKLSAFFKIEAAANGKEGLQKCEELSPDLVISDIMMPEVDGYELCHSIKNNERISHIPVVLLTAKSNSASKLQGLQLGADAYMKKPFELDILVAQCVAMLKTREKIWKHIGENPFFKTSEVTFTTRDEEFLNKITSLIESNMSKTDFTVEQLAALYETAQDNLNKKIKALTGKTCVQFIRLVRLRKAALLLKSPHNRVSDVTYEVGYSDLQHFREHFKKEFSLSPSAYKKQHSN